MAQHQQPDHSGEAITFLKVQPYQSGGVTLRSEAIDADGWLSADHAQAGEDISPALSWSGPPEVVSWALVVEDPDAPQTAPAIHWLAWNIPGAVTELPADIDKSARSEVVNGMIQGLNSRGRHGWLGMAPPAGHGPHRYHFQLFGLDRTVELAPETPLPELLNLLKGATIAKAELVGRFQALDGSLDAPSPARTGSYGGDAETRRRTTDAEIEAGRGGLDRDDPDRHAPHDPSGTVR